MRRVLSLILLLLPVAAGCSSTRVTVETRVTPNLELRERLAGPRYVIRAPEDEAEASLAFQEFAHVWATAIEMHRPALERVDVDEPADFAFLLHVTVADQGTGVTSYPIYGRRYGRVYGPCGPGYYSSFGIVGTGVRTVHLGYARSLFASAYVLDETGPGGRRVLWEGVASTIGDEPGLGGDMPYLALVLAKRLGESTDGSLRVRVSSEDDEFEMLEAWLETGHRPPDDSDDD